MVLTFAPRTTRAASQCRCTELRSRARSLSLPPSKWGAALICARGSGVGLSLPPSKWGGRVGSGSRNAGTTPVPCSRDLARGDGSALDYCSNTPLHHAADRSRGSFVLVVGGRCLRRAEAPWGEGDVVRLLLEHKVDASATNSTEYTPLHNVNPQPYTPGLKPSCLNPQP